MIRATCAKHIFPLVVTALMLFAIGHQPATSAPPTECDCTGDTVRNVNFCINGTNYNALVYFCEQNYSAPNLGTGPCTGLQNQHRISVVSKICFPNGRPIGVTDQQIFGYMLCDMLNTGCTFGNQWRVFRPVLNGTFCWTVQLPKCTTYDANGCIVPCGTCLLCRTELVWTVVNGVCTPSYTQCNQLQDCDQNCTNGACQEPICCP